MCGIYGALGCGLDAAAARRALDTLAHRGPDGEGEHHDPARDVYLGHRRLSIIDLSPAGAQPMTNEDGSLVLTFNGEIYNHAALRAELQARGHAFRGHCDAEVILHLFEEEGMRLLGRLHGMFAFALWDVRSGELFLARDRIGIKPLHYHHDGRKLVFASELKAIRATPGLALEPDVSAYWDFLTYQFVPTPKTVWRRTFKLPPAHYARFQAGALEVRRYWDVRFEPVAGSRTRTDALDELEALLDTVVRDHLVSDVPVGSFLSGGLDSTLVTTLARRAVEGPLETFTIRFPDDAGTAADESGLALANADRLGLSAHLRDFGTAELRERLPRALDLFDEPFGDHSFLPTLAVSELARETMKVTLSGDGGDETHLGYGRYFKTERRRLASAVADALPFAGALVRATPLRRVQGLRSAVEGSLGRLCHYYGGLPRATKRLLVGDLPPELADYDDYWLYREHLDETQSPHGRQQLLDLRTSLPDGILTKVDRASMAVGLEVRPPLLDHRLVEFAARLPDQWKHEAGRGKALLRAVLEERIDPGSAAGPKRGFSIPLKRFVRDEGWFRLERDLDVLGAFRIGKRAVEDVLSPRKDAQKLWVIDCLARFCAAGAA